MKQEQASSPKKPSRPKRKGQSKGPGKAQQFSLEEVRDALEKAFGAVTLAAEHLNCSRQTLYDYMERYPDLKLIRVNSRPKLAELCLSKLYLAAERGERWAVLRGFRRYGKYFKPELDERRNTPGVSPKVTKPVEIEFVNADRSEFVCLFPPQDESETNN